MHERAVQNPYHGTHRTHTGALVPFRSWSVKEEGCTVGIGDDRLTASIEQPVLITRCVFHTLLQSRCNHVIVYVPDYRYICPLGKTHNHRSRGDTPWRAQTNTTLTDGHKGCGMRAGARNVPGMQEMVPGNQDAIGEDFRQGYVR